MVAMLAIVFSLLLNCLQNGTYRLSCRLGELGIRGPWAECASHFMLQAFSPMTKTSRIYLRKLAALYGLKSGEQQSRGKKRFVVVRTQIAGLFLCIHSKFSQPQW